MNEDEKMWLSIVALLIPVIFVGIVALRVWMYRDYLKRKHHG